MRAGSPPEKSPLCRDNAALIDSVHRYWFESCRSAPAGPRLEFPAGGASVLLKRIDFDASRFLDAAELDAIRVRYVGRQVDLAEIGKILQAVNDLYAGKGQITASAVLPPQKLTGGVLKISLVEGRVGKVSISGASTTS